MEITRLRSDSIDIAFDGYDPETEYRIELIDRLTGDEYEQIVETDEQGSMSFDLLLAADTYRIHDGFFNALISKQSGQNWQVHGQETVDVVRPYANYAEIAVEKSISEIEARRAERLARQIIDSYVGNGFYYVRNQVSLLGLGADYLPLSQPIWGLESISENGVEIWNSTEEWSVNYAISSDRSAIVEEAEGDLEEYRPVWWGRYSSPAFPDGYEYVVVGSFGWPSVPTDVQDSAVLLVDDILCDNLRYTTKYIQTFETDAFKMRYAKDFLRGTGNKIVDDLLAKYVGNIRARVL